MVRSPGRINFIGEHTDYNDGFVFPAAIDKEIIFAVSKNSLKTHRVFAYDFKSGFEADIDQISKSNIGWANYLLGVLDQIKKRGLIIGGVDCVFGGNIPIGAGLSSSAALENGFAFALNELFDLNLTKEELIYISQKAEHEYAGVQCGIMDQFASMFGKENHSILLDCRDLSSEYISLNLQGFTIILVDSKVSHDLATSEYNTRRNECLFGVKLFQKYDSTIKSLRDVDIIELIKYKSEFDPVIYKRCKYVIEENERVLKASKALKAGDFINFGELMYQTHSGLKDEYEVSCLELDYLVETAKDSGYVIASRMMGGGFGGCTINIVKEENADDFCKMIKGKYTDYTGSSPEIHRVKIVDGTSIIDKNEIG